MTGSLKADHILWRPGSIFMDRRIYFAGQLGHLLWNIQFCSDTRHFVGHNIFYDKQYINFRLPHVFCTMKANTKILGLKRKDGRPKFPSLEETATFYGVEFDKSQLHGSMYDSLVTYQVFCRMLEDQKVKGSVLAFLQKE